MRRSRVIVPVPGDRIQEVYLEVAQGRKEPERVRKQAFATKQLQQPSGPGIDEAIEHVWRHDRAGIDQQFCGRRAGEPPFSFRIARVAISAGGESQQTTVIIIVLPGQQRRIFR